MKRLSIFLALVLLGVGVWANAKDPVSGKFKNVEILGNLIGSQTTSDNVVWPLIGNFQTVSVDNGFFSHIIVSSTWVDIRTYLPTNYVSDGSVDYSTQVQTALTALDNGSTLFFPILVGVGDNNWSGLTMSNKSHVNIVGINNGGLKLLALPTYAGLPHVTYNVGFLISDSSYIKVTGMNFYGNSIKANLLSFKYVTDSIVSNNYFNNIEFSDTFQPLLGSDGGTRNVYAFNKFEGGCYQLYTGSGANNELGVEKYSTIQGNTFNNPRGCIGATMWYSNIMGNTFYNCDIAINLGSSIATTHDVSVSGNNVYNCQLNGSGMRTDPSGNPLISLYNITYTGNTVDNCDTGFGLYKMYYTTVSGNTVSNASYSGIGLTDVFNSVVNANIVNGVPLVASFGITAWGGGSLIISNNKVSGFSKVNAQAAGIEVGGWPGPTDNVLITGNIVTGNYGGIFVEEAINVGVFNNLVLGNLNKDIIANHYYAMGEYGAITEPIRLYGSGNIYSTYWGHRMKSPLGGMNNSKTIYLGVASSVPTDNAITCSEGDFVFSTSSDNVIGWKCVTAGQPGTWQAIQGQW